MRPTFAALTRAREGAQTFQMGGGPQNHQSEVLDGVTDGAGTAASDLGQRPDLSAYRAGCDHRSATAIAIGDPANIALARELHGELGPYSQ